MRTRRTAGAGSVPELMTTREAAEALGADPPVFRFIAHLLGLRRRVVGRAVVVTRDALDAVRAYLARVDPGGEFWDPAADPRPTQGSGPDAVTQPQVN